MAKSDLAYKLELTQDEAEYLKWVLSSLAVSRASNDIDMELNCALWDALDVALE